MTTKTKAKATTDTPTTGTKPAVKKAKAGPAAEQPAPAAAPATQAPTTPKLSALDAAARVLAEAKEALGCQDLVGRMAAAGYWASPAGKTPAGTLHAAIQREITNKGAASRFRKAGRGRFALATLP